MRGIEVRFPFGFVFAFADLYGRRIRGQDGNVPGDYIRHLRHWPYHIRVGVVILGEDIGQVRASPRGFMG
jgi:hypothetical protein